MFIRKLLIKIRNYKKIYNLIFLKIDNLFFILNEVDILAIHFL